MRFERLLQPCLLVLSTVSGLAAQPWVAPEERWVGRVAFGFAWQGAFAYQDRGLTLGGTVGHALGPNSILRLDVARSSFDAYADLGPPCPLGCTEYPRAPDRLRIWSTALSWEQRHERTGIYAVGGTGVVHTSGEGLAEEGSTLALTAGAGIRLGHYFRLEARAVKLMGRSSTEGWLVPLTFALGP